LLRSWRQADAFLRGLEARRGVVRGHRPPLDAEGGGETRDPDEAVEVDANGESGSSALKPCSDHRFPGVVAHPSTNASENRVRRTSPSPIHSGQLDSGALSGRVFSELRARSVGPLSASAGRISDRASSPATLGGSALTGCSPATRFDPLRVTVILGGLEARPGRTPGLRGEFVAITDTA